MFVKTGPKLVHFEIVEWYKCSALSLYDLESEWSSEKGGKKDPINSARCIKELASWPVHSNNVLLLQMTDLFLRSEGHSPMNFERKPII